MSYSCRSALRLGAFSLLLLSLPALAQVSYGGRPAKSSDDQVYTWVDSKGVRHYGDGSTATANEFVRSQSRGVQLTMSAESRANFGRPIEAGATTEEPAPASTDKMTSNWEDGANPGEKLAPTRSAACEVAKRNVSVLSDASQPAYVRDASGNPVALDSAGRAERLDQANRDVSAYCAG